MDDAVFIAELGFRNGRFGLDENFIDAPLRIGVKHEELAGVGLRVAKKFEAVSLRPGKSLFVAEDHAGGIIFELACANEAASRAALFRAWDGIFLGISVERWRGILPHDAVRHPSGECGSGTRIDVVLRRVVGMTAALFNSNEVVGIGGVILLLHGRRNFVVRLGEDTFKRGACGIVAEGAKRKNLS